MNTWTSEHRFVLAADVGQSHDYTAVTIIHDFLQHRQPRDGEFTPPKPEHRQEIVHIERWRQLAYPAQADRVAERFHELEAHIDRFYDRDTRATLVVDATGVGKAFLDLLRERKLRARGITITGGDSVTRGDGMDRVPKRDLVVALQVALQSGHLKISRDLPLADALEKELLGFRVKINLNGRAQFGNDFGAWREADHDDLVLSAALGVWTLKHRRGTSAAVLRKVAALI